MENFVEKFTFKSSGEEANYYNTRNFVRYNLITFRPANIFISFKTTQKIDDMNCNELLDFFHKTKTEAIYKVQSIQGNDVETVSIKLEDVINNYYNKVNNKCIFLTQSTFKDFKWLKFKSPHKQGKIKFVITPGEQSTLKMLKEYGYDFDVTISAANGPFSGKAREILPMHKFSYPAWQIIDLFVALAPGCLIILVLWSTWRIVHLFERRRIGKISIA